MAPLVNVNPICESLLEELFPFTFSLDTNGMLFTHLGPSLRTLIPAAQEGDHVADWLELKVPSCTWEANSLKAALKTSVFALQVKGAQATLRGQMLAMMRAGVVEFVFVGSVWLGAEQSLSDLGLSTTDLALHDSASDLQHLVQTQSRATERAERFSQSILDTAPAGIFAADVRGRLIRCNDELLRLVGRTAAPSTGTLITELLGESILSSFREFAVARNDVGFSRAMVEVVVPGADGLERSLQLVLGMEGDRGREIYTGVVLDTTELKTAQFQVRQADRQAHNASQKLRRFFNVSVEMLCRMGLTGTIEELNPSWQRTLGHSMQQLQSAPFLEFVHPHDREATQKLFQRLAAGESCLNFENRLRCRDGSYRWLLWSAVLDSDNNSIIAAARDITDRVNTLRELRQAKRAAEAANEAKTQFLANMSHELRTPLNSIIGFSRLVARSDGLLSLKKEQKYLSRVTDNGTHLLSLINDILDLSKVEAGHVHLQTSTVLLAPLLREILDSTQAAGEHRGLDLTLDVDADCGAVLVDILRFKQVLLNLVSNAIKFTERGRVCMRLRRNPANKFEQWVEVQDTGMGIADDKLELIFEPFRQVENTTSRTHGGTGLGLAISRSLCEQMGVKITVKSKVLAGSTFRLSLPSACSDHTTLPITRRNNHEENCDSGRQPGQPITRIRLAGRPLCDGFL